MHSGLHDEPASAGALVLHLLGKCNLKCLHCYMEGAPTRHERLSIDDVIHAVEDCAALRITSLAITGGEPLLYPDLRRVLAAAAGVPGLTTTLCTNATLLTDHYIEPIATLGIRLNVSVDGTPVYHDAFRQESGAFAKTEEGIKAAVSARVPVTVIMTVTHGNLTSIAAMAEWALEKGVSVIRFQPLLRLGRGVTIADQRLSVVETNDLIIQVSDLANKYRGRLTCKIIGQTLRFFRMHPCAAYVCNGTGCHRGVSREIKTIVVRESGAVLPEAPNLSPRFAMGQIEDARLPSLFTRFLKEDYGRFDALCRKTYSEVLPNWEAAIVPWDQILSESSYSFEDSPIAHSSSDWSCSTRCERLGEEEIPAKPREEHISSL
jgi:MoaA/NifB/PqqE/SkfB family radical SAM enzyme